MVTQCPIFRLPSSIFHLACHGKRWGFEFKCADAPSTTKSMHIAMNDLGLEHLWVVYPGTRKYALTERMTALPLRELPGLELA